MTKFSGTIESGRNIQTLHSNFPYIETTENPQIGDFFMVRTVRLKRNDIEFIWPVFAESHCDSVYELEEEHYHPDWRFMPQKILDEHREYRQNQYLSWKELNAEYFSPIMKKEVIEEFYKEWEYLRDDDFPHNSFGHLADRMKECGAKMKGMKCPHHGTNLVSCRVVNDIVTCPQHGLKWNIKTGELAIENW